VTPDQLEQLISNAWDKKTYSRYKSIYNKFTSERKISNPFFIDYKHIINFAINYSQSPSYRLFIITAITTMLKTQGIDLISKHIQLKLVMKGLKREALESRAPPKILDENIVNNIQEHCDTRKNSNDNEEILSLSMLLLMTKMLLRPSDVSWIVRSTIKISNRSVKFQMFRTKGAKLSNNAYSPTVTTSNKTLATLLQKVIQITPSNAFYLFISNKTRKQFSPDRISKRVQQILRQINIDIKSRELRSIGASYYIHNDIDIDTVLQLGTWKKDVTFLRHYLRSRNRS